MPPFFCWKIGLECAGISGVLLNMSNVAGLERFFIECGLELNLEKKTTANQNFLFCVGCSLTGY